jgi:hypothetical protein
MPKLSDERKEFLHSIFTTALEGGIGYWSQASTYHWMLPAPKGQEWGADDLDGFYAIVHEWDEDEGDYAKNKGHRIDRAVIQKGLNALIDGKARAREDIVKTIMLANRENDAGDIDSEIADVIVQVGLFGEIVYG